MTITGSIASCMLQMLYCRKSNKVPLEIIDNLNLKAVELVIQKSACVLYRSHTNLGHLFVTTVCTVKAKKRGRMRIIEEPEKINSEFTPTYY